VQCLFQSMSLQVQPHLTKRAPDAGESGAIPSIFLRLIIFPVRRRPAARPSAGNANRWQAEPKSKCKTVFDTQVLFCDWLRV